MNPVKIGELGQQKFLSDLTLTIKDESTTLVMSLHKFVLYCGAPYFEKLLTKLDADISATTITVPNAIIVRDIILSFYGMTFNDNDTWEYALDMCTCRDFLCLSVSLHNLYHLTIPSTGLDQLIQIIESVGCTIDGVLLLRTNLATTNDLVKLPAELKKDLLHINCPFHILINSIDNGVRTLSLLLSDTSCMDFMDKSLIGLHLHASSSNGQYVLCELNGEYRIYSWRNMLTTYQCLELESPSKYVPFQFSPDNAYIVGSNEKCCHIWDIRGKLCGRLQANNNKIFQVDFFPDSNNIMVQRSFPFSISIYDIHCSPILYEFYSDPYCLPLKQNRWVNIGCRKIRLMDLTSNVETQQYDFTKKGRPTIYKTICDPIREQLVFLANKQFYLFDLALGEMKAVVIDRAITDIRYSPDYQYIIAISDADILVYDREGTFCHIFYECATNIVSFAILPNDKWQLIESLREENS